MSNAILIFLLTVYELIASSALRAARWASSVYWANSTGHLDEPDLVARLELGQIAEIRRDHVGDLRISAGGLPVGQHDDGLTSGRDLDGAEGDAVRDDVAALSVGNDLASRRQPMRSNSLVTV